MAVHIEPATYESACRALAARTEELRELRAKVAALAACTRYAFGGQSDAAEDAVRLLKGEYDPRDDARRWLLEYDENGEAL